MENNPLKHFDSIGKQMLLDTFIAKGIIAILNKVEKGITLTQPEMKILYEFRQHFDLTLQDLTRNETAANNPLAGFEFLD